jgi:L-seryl-tRNA(Ser) seleniumtransferase
MEYDMRTLLEGWNRRQFLTRAGLASSLAGTGSLLSPANLFGAARVNGARKSVYTALGVRPFINAGGTYTTLSASLVPREVAEAMQDASRQYVSIPELHEAVGKRIAALTGAEAALVTSGAAGSLLLGTAACVAGKDQERIRRIPDTTGMKNEVIIQKKHRFGYDHAVRNVGTKLIEVETRADLDAALAGGRVAMMIYLNSNDPLGAIKRAEWVEVGKKAGVPTLIDAAADVPPVEHLSEYTRMGFDLVCISGGKGLRGPQCSGLLLGRKDLIEAAYLNGSPHSDAVGRPGKVGKEEIVGLWTALEVYMKKDHKAEWRDWESQVKAIAGAVDGIRGVKTEPFVPEIANQVPHLRVSWDEKVIPVKNERVVKLLRDGEPRIELRPSAGDKPFVEIAVWMLEPGEHKLVARRLQEVLKAETART